MFRSKLLYCLIFAQWAHCSGRGGVALRTHIAPPKPKVSSTLKVLTWNVYKYQAVNSIRIPRLLQTIRSANADIIALQEVSDAFLKLLKRQDWISERYNLTRFGRDLEAPGGLYILSRFPITMILYKEMPRQTKKEQVRGVLVAFLKVDGRRIAVANVHLNPALQNGQIRAAQLDAIFPVLRSEKHSILLGDFNFGDKARPETDHLDHDFFDLWRALRPHDPGYTFDKVENGLARQHGFPGEQSRRLDRILVHSDHLFPRDVHLVGTCPVRAGDPSLFPSDHFGVLGTLAWAE